MGDKQQLRHTGPVRRPWPAWFGSVLPCCRLLNSSYDDIQQGFCWRAVIPTNRSAHPSIHSKMRKRRIFAEHILKNKTHIYTYVMDLRHVIKSDYSPLWRPLWWHLPLAWVEVTFGLLPVNFSAAGAASAAKKTKHREPWWTMRIAQLNSTQNPTNWSSESFSEEVITMKMSKSLKVFEGSIIRSEKLFNLISQVGYRLGYGHFEH